MAMCMGTPLPQVHIGSTPGKVLFKVLFFALFLGKTLFFGTFIST